MANTSPIDLSVILTAHDETLVSGPTMQSADAAIAAARAAGFTVEPIIVLDNATPDCAAWFKQGALDHWARIELQEGDLGRARNAAVKRSKGAFIAFLDADDLVSENWLSEGCKLLAAAREAGEKRIVHPELNWLFDGAKSVYYKPDQDDRMFTPWYFFAMNYYDSMCLCPREVHETIPYASRDIPNGLSFQDWQFSVETMFAGWRHVSARDTIIFKRRRDTSLVTESRARQAIVRALDGMAIDQIAQLGAPLNRAPVPAEVLEAPLWPKSQVPSLRTRVQAYLARRRGQELDIPAPLPSHAGDILARRIPHTRYRSNPSKAWLRRDYTAVAEVFDTALYYANRPDLLVHKHLDPVSHYLRAGAAEGRRALPLFGEEFYLRRYPELGDDPSRALGHFLREGRAKGYIGAPYDRFEVMAKMLDLTPQEAEALLNARFRDLRSRLETGGLGDMAQRAAQIEPLISAAWPEALEVKVPPFHSNVVVNRAAACFEMGQQVGLKRARAVICVNRARWGGARRMEGHIAHALAQGFSADEIVVVSTEASGKLPKGRVPDGVRHVDLSSQVTWLRVEEAARVLVQFLRALRPEVVFNVNSRLMWDAIGPYGLAMRASFRIIGCLFCNEQSPLGYAAGYPLSRVYRHFDVLSAIVTDSHALVEDLRARHMMGPQHLEKMVVLSAPVDRSIPVAAAPAPLQGRRPQVFWSGRFDAQKRVELLYEIARARPDIDFRMWGAAVMEGGPLLPAKPDNVIHEGTYAHFADLPMGQADLWLYTAAWDGVPSILLEVAMTGVPLVGSDVGGTAEVLQPGMAQALPADADAAAYCAAIDTVLGDPDAARANAAALRETLIAARDQASYTKAVSALMTGETA
ncbi:MAG: glycosyltransferase [Sulfitobacter sp.]